MFIFDCCYGCFVFTEATETNEFPSWINEDDLSLIPDTSDSNRNYVC